MSGNMAEPDREPILVPLTQGRPRTFVVFLCDGLSARRVASFAGLLDLQQRLQGERSTVRVLASLDDLGQACYTSGHSADHHGLDDTEGHDLSGLSPEAFDEGEHQGYLSTPSEFPIRLANLRRLAADVGLDQIVGVLPWNTDDDANDLVSINRDPDATLQIADENPVVFLYAPVEIGADAIAAFPNGYFSSDLDPMQNYALARHLEAKFGLVLFGIGSRFLGFRRATALTDHAAEQLCAELVGLYSDAPPEAAQTLARLITGRTWLLIRYTES
jgi:hypothetical protein